MNVLTYLDSLDSDVRKKIIKWASRVPANRLSHCRQIRLNSGQTLVHMLDRVDNVYILCRGTVRTTSHNSAGRTYMLSELTRDQIHRGVVEWPFTVRLTRQELADKIGTSTKTVARGIDELKERGMVSVQHGKIVITERQFQRLDDAMKHEGETHLLD